MFSQAKKEKDKKKNVLKMSVLPFKQICLTKLTQLNSIRQRGSVNARTTETPKFCNFTLSNEINITVMPETLIAFPVMHLHLAMSISNISKKIARF